MNRARWPDFGLLVAGLVLIGAVLHAGLSPYDFFVRNHVSWSEGAAGLHFERRGIAATEEAIEFAASASAPPLGLELWLRRDASVSADGGVVLALGDGKAMPPLLLAQWKDSLYFRFPALADGILTEQTLSMRERFPEGEARFVALASGAAGTRVYLDGVEVPFPPGLLRSVPAPDALRGRLVLGSRIQAVRGWSGRVEGLALYRRTLSPAEVAGHAAAARASGVRALAGAPGLFALYAFDEGAGARVRDLAGGAGDLLIPPHYRPLGAGLLQLPWNVPGGPATGADAVANLVLFLPVGLLSVWILRRWTALDRTALWLTAAGFGFALSLAIETTQALLPSRISSAGDLAANSAGAAIGAVLALAATGLAGRPLAGTRARGDSRPS